MLGDKRSLALVGSTASDEAAVLRFTCLHKWLILLLYSKKGSEIATVPAYSVFSVQTAM